MTSFRRLLACFALSACTWVSDDDLEARLDLDGDGVPAAEDCDPGDGQSATLTDGFADADGDGAGDPLEPQTFCGPLPDGWVNNALDQCPDHAGLTLPNLWWGDSDGDEIGTPDTTYSECTDVPGPGRAWPGTPDCDDTDPSAGFLVDWFPDSDGDGFGDTGSAAQDGCGAPTSGFSLVANDACPELAALLQPVPYHVDDDRDGFGTAATESLCAISAPPGHTSREGDCDDSNPLVHDEQIYYADGDNDGFGTDVEMPACSEVPPTGAAAQSGDCDDNAPTTNPAVALDVCDETDNDCDGLLDEDDQGTLYFVDSDQDGYPSAAQQILCAPDIGFVAAALAPTDADGGTLFDCDDSNPLANPGQVEIYDEPMFAIVDNDCNPVNDRDEDGDGEDGYDGPDCDDKNPNIASFRAEVYYNDLDDDCDPTTVDDDQDGDGFLASTEGGDDCNDRDDQIHPGALEKVEVGAGIDDNCNGPVGVSCGLDVDGDGFGSLQLVAFDGDTPDDCVGLGEAGLPVGRPGDCDDTDRDVFPGTVERCDGIDGNCDGDADSQLITLTLDGVLSADPVLDSVPPSLSPDAEWLLEICNTTPSPLPVNFDFGALDGRNITVRGIPRDGAPVDEPPPAITANASGSPLFRTEGIGRLTVENLFLQGDGLADVEVLGGDVELRDALLSGVQVYIDGTLDDADTTLARVVLDQSTVTAQTATVELDEVTVTGASSPVLDATAGSIAFLQDVTLESPTTPLVQAESSSVTVVGIVSIGSSASSYVLTDCQLTDLESRYEGATAPIYDLSGTSVTAIGADYSSNQAELVVAVGGSSTLLEADFIDGASPAIIVGVDHDVTLRDFGRWIDGDRSNAGAARIQLLDGDLTIANALLNTCPSSGLASIINGDLEVESIYVTCDAASMVDPLFVTTDGNVDILKSTFASTSAVPPFVLDVTAGSVILRTVYVTTTADLVSGFLPTMSVIDVLDSDLKMADVILQSTNCKGSCTAAQAVTLVQANNAFVQVEATSTVSEAAAFALTGESEMVSGGTLFPIPGSVCSGAAPLQHTGPVGIALDSRATANVIACGTSGLQDTAFGTCMSRGLVIGAFCQTGSCTCL